MNRVRKVAFASGGLIAAGALLVGAIASNASASPPANDRSPIGGEHAHTHHIHPDGGADPNNCVDIDEVRFEPGGHGLHHGVESSKENPHRRLWHGTCDGKVYPGGDPLPGFVPHHN